MGAMPSARKPGAKPTVSVVVPVYNRPGLVTQAVRSALFQTYFDLEVIVVDDGSHTFFEEMVERFSPDPRFRYTRIEHSGMPGKVRNRGVAQARGEFIAFLDSDDIWYPEKLELQMDLFRKLEEQGRGEDVPLVHCREVWMRDGKVVNQKGQLHRRSGDVFTDSLCKCTIGPSTAVIRTKVFRSLGGFRENLEVAEDYELWLRLTSRYEVGYVDRPLIIKRAGHEGQLSEKYGQIEIFRIDALRKLVEGKWFSRQFVGGEAEERMGRELQNRAEQEYSRKCRIYAKGSRKRGKTAEAKWYEEVAETYRLK
ncbi:MAG: glycosyltransferase family 2 protein [Spirochaetaceae bacterium]